VYGDPEPSYQWTIREPKAVHERVLSDQKRRELVILDIRVENAAYYGCSAKNRAGRISVDAVLVDVDSKWLSF
jgi:hypothetical protein